MPAAANRHGSRGSARAYPWAVVAWPKKSPRRFSGWPANRRPTPAAHCWMSAADAEYAAWLLQKTLLSSDGPLFLALAQREIDAEQGIDPAAIVLPAQRIEQREGLGIAAGEHRQPLLQASRGITRGHLAPRLQPEIGEHGWQRGPVHFDHGLPGPRRGDLPGQVRPRHQAAAEHDVFDAADFAAAPPVVQRPHLAI